jgi:hypothetical protein
MLCTSTPAPSTPNIQAYFFLFCEQAILKPTTQAHPALLCFSVVSQLSQHIAFQNCIVSCQALVTHGRLLGRLILGGSWFEASLGK